MLHDLVAPVYLGLVKSIVRAADDQRNDARAAQAARSFLYRIPVIGLLIDMSPEFRWQ
ncbi:MAG: hypothetical protein JSU67_15690 [Gammaproteobacteria bacterium]|nr:MAG: hypothetical protein JSU67_15690 [Gammaproteobacteria bacterium]